MIKNFFANKYGFTPEQTESLDVRLVDGFLILEGERVKREESERRKQDHLSRQKGRSR